MNDNRPPGGPAPRYVRIIGCVVDDGRVILKAPIGPPPAARRRDQLRLVQGDGRPGER